MFDELHQYLGWTNNFPRDEVLLVFDEGSDSGFFTHHFISCFLKQRLPVCLISTSQTFNHYAQVGTKIGANLEKALNDGIIHHIDLMSMYLKHYLEPNNEGWSVLHVYETVKEGVSMLLKSSASALVIIDDVSVLSSLFSPSDVKHFLHHLRLLSKSMEFSVALTMPTFGHKQTSIVQNFATHHADTILRVRPLQTGYSKDVHGQLEIIKGRGGGDRQFKLSDKCLHLFATGTSTAVL